MGTGSLSQVNRPGRGVEHPFQYSVEVLQSLQLRLCSLSLSGHWRSVLEWMSPLPLPFQWNIELALTFDLGADKIHLIAVGWSSSKESNPVAVTHAASVHLRYLVVTTKPMPNLQHEPKRYVMTHIYICVFKRQFCNCCHMGDFCCSNQLFNIGQYRKEECFRGLIEVLPDCFCWEWRKPLYVW